MGNRSILPILCIALLLGTALAVIPGTVSKAEAQTMNLENAEITLLDPDKHLYRYTTLPAPKITSPEGVFENYHITDNSNSITFTSTAHEFEFNKDTCSFTVRDGDGNTELGNMAQKFYINSGSRWQDITPESCTVELTDSNKTHARIIASSDSRGVEFDVIFDIYYAGYVEWTYEITNNQRDIPNPQLGIVEICTDCTSADNPFLNQDGTVSDPLAFRQAGLDDKASKGEGAPGKREYDHEAIGDKLLSIGAGMYDPKNDQHGTLSAIRLDNNNMEVEFFGTEALPFGQTLVIDPSYESIISHPYYHINMLTDPPTIGRSFFTHLQFRNDTNYRIGYAQFDISGIPNDAIINNIAFAGNVHSYDISGGIILSLYPSPFQITPLSQIRLLFPVTPPSSLTAQQATQLNQTINGDRYYTTEILAAEVILNERKHMPLNNNAIRDLEQKLEQDLDTFELLAGVQHYDTPGNSAQYGLNDVTLIIDYELVGSPLVIDAAPALRYLGVESPDNYNHALGSSWTVQDRSDGTFKVGNQDTRTLAGGIQFDVSEIGDNWQINDLAVGMQILEVNGSTANFEFARGPITMPDPAPWSGPSLSQSQQAILNAFTDKITRSHDYTPAGSINTVTEAGYHVFELNDRAKSDLESSVSQITNTETFTTDIFRPNIRTTDSDTAWYMKVNADPPAGGTGIKPKLYINYTVPEFGGRVSNIQLANLAPVSDTEIDYTFTWDYTGTEPEHFVIKYSLSSHQPIVLTPNGTTFTQTIRDVYEIYQLQVLALFPQANTDPVAIYFGPPEDVSITPNIKEPLNPAQIRYGWTHNYEDYDIPDLAFELQYRPVGGDAQSVPLESDVSSYVISAIPEKAYEARVAFKVGNQSLDTTDWGDVTSGSWPEINNLSVDTIKARSIDISFEYDSYSWLDDFRALVYGPGNTLLYNDTITSTARTATIEPGSHFPAGSIRVSVTPYASDGSDGPPAETRFSLPGPTPMPIEPQIVDEGDTVDYMMLVGNPADQDITWLIASGKRGDAVIESDGRFTWTPEESDGPGTYTFDILAEAVTKTIEYELNVTVNEVNQPPFFDDVDPNQLAISEVPFTLDLDATDPDIPAQTVSYGIVSQDLPDNPVTLDTQTGLITWTPTAPQTKTKTITVRASDDHTPAATADITLYIEGRAPKRDYAKTETGTSLVIFPIANDGTNAKLSVVRDPPNGNIVISGDAVLYTPGTGHTGQDTFRYRMQYTDDDRRTTYPARITVTVSTSIDNNSPPVLEHIPNQDATRSETLTFSVTATDPNAGDDIQYMLFNQPDGATITQDGVFSWTPTDDHSDTTYEVIVVAADDKLMVGKQEVTITVSDP